MSDVRGGGKQIETLTADLVWQRLDELRALLRLMDYVAGFRPVHPTDAPMAAPPQSSESAPKREPGER